METIDILAQQAYADAIRRGKTETRVNHWAEYLGIKEELQEFCRASETKVSEHLEEFTEAEEELADVMICCMTELTKRGIRISEILRKKIEFNSTRE